MNSHVLKELLKLYPKVKIPVDSLSDFYIETLSKDKSFHWLKNRITELENCYITKGDLTKYKMDISGKLLLCFSTPIKMPKSFNEILNDFTLPHFIYEKKSFNDYKDDNFYISIDLSEANYNVYKKYSGLYEWFKQSNELSEFADKNWRSFLENCWNVDVSISQSKSFRQLVLGNTNPKRLARLQEFEMSKIETKLLTFLQEKNIVIKNSDEIVVEITNNDEIVSILASLNKLEFDLPVKHTIYKMIGHKNLSEFVRVKTIYDDQLNEINKELFGVVGTRFFMHFRTLILNEKLHENDLIYMNDGFKSKWII